MGLKELLLAKLLGLNETDSPTTWFSNDSAPAIPPQTITPVPDNITSTPTLEPTFYTFPPVGAVQSYVLVTPVGVNQMQNLTYDEQAVVSFKPLVAVLGYNYLYVQADASTAAKLVGVLYPNSAVPPLQDIVSDSPACPVRVDDDYAIWVIGSLDNLDMVQSAVTISTATPYSPQRLVDVNGVVTSAHNSNIKSYRLDNPRFTGSDIIAYVPDGNTGAFTTLGNTDSVSVLKAFADVLKQVKIRGAKNNRIVYIGDHSNDLVAGFISELNQTIPIDMKLDDALTQVMKNFFTKQCPSVQLDANGCPVVGKDKLSKLTLRPFSCSEKFPIHGMTTNLHDYGFRFKVPATNRWFEVKVIVPHENCAEEDANIGLRFGKEGLQITKQKCPQLPGNNDTDFANQGANTILFPANGLVNAGRSYEVEIKHDDSVHGLGDAMQINIRRQGDRNFKNLGLVVVQGDSQPRAVMFCGFSPNNTAGVKGARTQITNIETLYKLPNVTDLEDAPRRRRVVAEPK